MSRIGKLPIDVPSGVTITVDNDNIIVNGPKGSLSQFSMPGLKVLAKDNQVFVERENDERFDRARHGLMRTLINNIKRGKRGL